MEVDREFFVDRKPARRREVRLQNGDCPTEIFHHPDADADRARVAGLYRSPHGAGQESPS